MTRTIHTVLQVLGFIVSLGTMATNYVPAKYKPYVVLAVSAAQGILAWYNHNFNPDGTPATTAYVAKLLLLFLLLGGVAKAQTPAPPAPSNTFALNAYAVALPGGHQTIAGTLAVPTWNITPSFALRETTLISGPLNGYLGGFNYQLPGLSTALNNASPYLNGNQFRFYLTGSAGVDKASGGGQHYAFLGGGGVLYDPTHTGKFTVTIVEAQYAKLPGYANNTAIVASGIGTTPAALGQVAMAPVKMVAKAFRRTPSK